METCAPRLGQKVRGERPPARLSPRRGHTNVRPRFDTLTTIEVPSFAPPTTTHTTYTLCRTVRSFFFSSRTPLRTNVFSATTGRTSAERFFPEPDRPPPPPCPRTALDRHRIGESPPPSSPATRVRVFSPPAHRFCTATILFYFFLYSIALAFRVAEKTSTAYHWRVHGEGRDREIS